MTAIRLNPILSLILNNQSRATTLDSVIGSRNRLKLARIPQRPHVQLPYLKPIIITSTLRNQPRKQLHRVLRLILRNSQNLNPSIRLLTPHKTPVIPLRNNRPTHRRCTKHSRQRIFAPTLQALENRRTILKRTRLSARIKPENKTCLLQSELPRQTIIAIKPQTRPRQNIPADSQLRKQPTSLFIPLPRRPNLHRLPLEILRRTRIS